MRLRFLGTRGEIDARTRRHRRHSALLVGYRRREVMIDCGLDWREGLARLRPSAIVLTHAHPDHAAGLRDGAPSPVYATEETWTAIAHYPIAERQILEPRRPRLVRGIEFEAFPVEHSLRAPAVGYRVRAGRVTIVYAPDLVSFIDEEEALSGIDLYIGDGAAVTRSIIRRRDGRAIGPCLDPGAARVVRRCEGPPRRLHPLRLRDRKRRRPGFCGEGPRSRSGAWDRSVDFSRRPRIRPEVAPCRGLLDIDWQEPALRCLAQHRRGTRARAR